MKIRIENPTPGGARFTSLARARLYESQGCAKLSADGRRLRFYESHYRKQSAELSAQEMADQQHRLSAAGYDGRKTVLTLEEMSHLRVLIVDPEWKSEDYGAERRCRAPIIGCVDRLGSTGPEDTGERAQAKGSLEYRRLRVPTQDLTARTLKRGD